jgi:hypothetical protein
LARHQKLGIAGYSSSRRSGTRTEKLWQAKTVTEPLGPDQNPYPERQKHSEGHTPDSDAVWFSDHARDISPNPSIPDPISPTGSLFVLLFTAILVPHLSESGTGARQVTCCTTLMRVPDGYLHASPVRQARHSIGHVLEGCSTAPNAPKLEAIWNFKYLRLWTGPVPNVLGWEHH